MVAWTAMSLNDMLQRWIEICGRLKIPSLQRFEQRCVDSSGVHHGFTVVVDTGRPLQLRTVTCWQEVTLLPFPRRYM